MPCFLHKPVTGIVRKLRSSLPPVELPIREERRSDPEGEPMQAFRSRTTARIDLLPPEREARLSGATARNLDYVDAEFETIATAARPSPYPVFNDNRRAGHRTRHRGKPVRQALTVVETRLRGMPPRQFAGLVSGLGLGVFLLIAGLFSGGQADSKPLSIGGVTTSFDYAGGMRVLSVYGSIDNRSSTEQRLPLVVVDVRSNGRKVTATRLMPDGASIAPGESRHFAARLPYTGGKMPDVTVSFAESSVSRL
ncbi:MULTISPECIES: hypothetical protein [unclassified Sinorhizobium]|uniref:hypothetical protein n=1 Tax=unclassified Sinorhizobium TaxID=2613772 RepID=UPI0024C30631|nr:MULTISPECIES: hypothetical protein [unclassified Sinorhizobium]MDK1375141.1 hypothetical protein [Sinorhizobium sp. 6-70]MDK1480780.1 hypothetical protein [Sinorhizobium sp. 6-117]